MRDRSQCFDRSHYFHAVVGGGGLRAAQHVLSATVADQRGPTAGTGITSTRAVSEDLEQGRRHRGLRSVGCGTTTEVMFAWRSDAVPRRRVIPTALLRPST